MRLSPRRLHWGFCAEIFAPPLCSRSSEKHCNFNARCAWFFSLLLRNWKENSGKKKNFTACDDESYLLSNGTPGAAALCIALPAANFSYLISTRSANFHLMRFSGNYISFARLHCEQSRYWKSLNLGFTETNFALFSTTKNCNCAESPMEKFVSTSAWEIKQPQECLMYLYFLA